MAIKKRLKRFQSETRKHVITAIMTAFGLILALTWKDVITVLVSGLVQDLTISTIPSSLLLLYSAIVTTIIAVIGIMILNRWATS